MARRRGVRPGLATGVVAGHPIAALDPVGAWNLDRALVEHLVPSTRRGYASAVKSYVSYCMVRHLSPFPVDEVVLAAYIIHVTSSIQVSSLKVYLAAVHHEQVTRGLPWSLGGSELVRRAMRWVKRRHMCPGKALKIPITLEILGRMLACVPGWPDVCAMTHDDRVFAAASSIAIHGFLRGGEFLASSGSSRALLRGRDVAVETIGGTRAVVVSIAQPKNMWWLDKAKAFCLSPPPDEHSPAVRLDPVFLWESYVANSPVPVRPDGPAFVMQSGRPMARDFMVRRTSDLLAATGVQLVDGSGHAVRVLASSWRAGGVRTAMDAGVKEAVIMAMGRWRSVAWHNYIMSDVGDLLRASQAMSAARTPTPITSFLVGDSPARMCAIADGEVEVEIRRLSVHRRAVG